MSPTRPKPFSELVREENVPEELRDSSLEEDEPEELGVRYGVTPDEYQELITSFQEVIDTSETTYLLLGSREEGRRHMESVQETLDEYPHVKAYLPIDLPTGSQPPLIVTLKLAADLIDHIILVMNGDATESEWMAFELGFLLEEYKSKTHILLHEDVASRPLSYLVYEALMVFQEKNRIHVWSSEDDLQTLINSMVMQHTNEGINRG